MADQIATRYGILARDLSHAALQTIVLTSAAAIDALDEVHQRLRRMSVPDNRAGFQTPRQRWEQLLRNLFPASIILVDPHGSASPDLLNLPAGSDEDERAVRRLLNAAASFLLAETTTSEDAWDLSQHWTDADSAGAHEQGESTEAILERAIRASRTLLDHAESGQWRELLATHAPRPTTPPPARATTRSNMSFELLASLKIAQFTPMLNVDIGGWGVVGPWSRTRMLEGIYDTVQRATCRCADDRPRVTRPRGRHGHSWFALDDQHPWFDLFDTLWWWPVRHRCYQLPAPQCWDDWCLRTLDVSTRSRCRNGDTHRPLCHRHGGPAAWHAIRPTHRHGRARRRDDAGLVEAMDRAWGAIRSAAGILVHPIDRPFALSYGLAQPAGYPPIPDQAAPSMGAPGRPTSFASVPQDDLPISRRLLLAANQVWTATTTRDLWVGLSRLESVGHDDPYQRQAVVNVLCAYLRTAGPHGHAPAAPPSTGPSGHHLAGGPADDRSMRLAVQTVLARHLRPSDDPVQPADTYWPDLDLDLTDTVLADVNFNRCDVRTADFRGTTFHGDAAFTGARIGAALFDAAQFEDRALFDTAVFAGDARFEHTSFRSDAVFDHARFHADARFDNAHFHQMAGFTRTVFDRDARFENTVFAGDLVFDRTVFTGLVRLGQAQLHHGVRFHETRLDHDARQANDNRYATLVALCLAQEPCWVRRDVRDTAAAQRVWPVGWTVQPTTEQPTGTAEGRWWQLAPTFASNGPSGDMSGRNRHDATSRSGTSGLLGPDLVDSALPAACHVPRPQILFLPAHGQPPDPSASVLFVHRTMHDDLVTALTTSRSLVVVNACASSPDVAASQPGSAETPAQPWRPPPNLVRPWELLRPRSERAASARGSELAAERAPGKAFRAWIRDQGSGELRDAIVVVDTARQNPTASAPGDLWHGARRGPLGLLTEQDVWTEAVAEPRPLRGTADTDDFHAGSYAAATVTHSFGSDAFPDQPLSPDTAEW